MSSLLSHKAVSNFLDAVGCDLGRLGTGRERL